MLRLHGFAASNYYNKAKLTLLEKQIPFEEVLQWADGSAALLAASPLGKIPYLETEHGFISETQAINEYLEATCPAHALMPSDAFQAAKVREIVASRTSISNGKRGVPTGGHSSVARRKVPSTRRSPRDSRRLSPH